MNSKYITCYRRKGEDHITIYISDRTKYEAIIYSCFISIIGHNNECLFNQFGINKWDLTGKLPYKYTYGAWPQCMDQRGSIALLNALIKETKIRYYEVTEI